MRRSGPGPELPIYQLSKLLAASLKDENNSLNYPVQNRQHTSLVLLVVVSIARQQGIELHLPDT